jgi:hypothetical protein
MSCGPETAQIWATRFFFSQKRKLRKAELQKPNPCSSEQSAV